MIYEGVKAFVCICFFLGKFVVFWGRKVIGRVELGLGGEVYDWRSDFVFVGINIDLGFSLGVE